MITGLAVRNEPVHSKKSIPREKLKWRNRSLGRSQLKPEHHQWHQNLDAWGPCTHTHIHAPVLVPPPLFSPAFWRWRCPSDWVLPLLFAAFSCSCVFCLLGSAPLCFLFCSVFSWCFLCVVSSCPSLTYVLRPWRIAHIQMQFTWQGVCPSCSVFFLAFFSLVLRLCFKGVVMCMHSFCTFGYSSGEALANPVRSCSVFVLVGFFWAFE